MKVQIEATPGFRCRASRALISVVMCFVVLAWSSAAKADIIVNGGTLAVGCSNQFGDSSHHINQLQNPMTETRSVVLHNSLAQAAYQFNWSLATGHFRIDADLTSEGGDGGPFCGTDNRINFHVTQDTLLSLDSEWTYQFNGGIRSSVIRFHVGDSATSIPFWSRGDVGDTVAGDPPTDTFHITDSILLTPGNYFVRSLMDLRAVGGSPNSVSTAHGFANITLTTVPEPSALALIAFGAIMICGRRPRQCVLLA